MPHERAAAPALKPLAELTHDEAEQIDRLVYELRERLIQDDTPQQVVTPRLIGKVFRAFGRRQQVT